MAILSLLHHAQADPSIAMLSSILKYCGKHRSAGISTGVTNGALRILHISVFVWRVSLCDPSWAQSYNPSASTSLVLGLQAAVPWLLCSVLEQGRM